MSLNHEAPLAGYDRRIGGSAGAGTHGGTAVSRPDGMPTRDESDYIVSNASDLQNKIQEDEATIYIDDDITFSSTIDVTTVGNNVELVGGFCDPEIPGRGPVIHYDVSRSNINDNSDDHQNPVFKKPRGGGGAPTLWGISFRGPEHNYFNPGSYPEAYIYATCGIWSVTETGTFKAIGCEFWDWTLSGILLGLAYPERGPTAEISRCSFHHNLMKGLGYGISQLRGELHCEKSYFESNRHGITSFGYPDASYELTDSVIGPDGWVGHAIDMHDYAANNRGGDYMHISNSTFKMTTGKPNNPGGEQEAIAQRGVSVSGDEIWGCDFWHDSRPVEPGTQGDAFRQENRDPTDPDSREKWENFYPHDNAYDGPNEGFGAPRATAQTIPGESRTVRTDQQGDEWQTVSLDGSYHEPVVLMKPTSQQGEQPCHVRFRNVGSDSFEFKLEEWDYLGGNHGEEYVSFMVLEIGMYRTSNGKQIIVRKRQNDSTFQSISFESAFDDQPVVLTQPQTYNGSDAIVSRTRNVSTDGFEVRLQEEEARNDGHSNETVGYIALEQGSVEMLGTEFEVNRTPREITDEWSRIDFQSSKNNTPSFLADMQTYRSNTCNLRHRDLTKDGVDVRVQEERSDDVETVHGTEAVGYVVSKEARTIDEPPRGETRTIRTDQSAGDWQTVSLNGSYQDPIVMMKPMSEQGAKACHVRLRNVGSDSFELKLEEWDYLGGNHGEEYVSFMILETGGYRTSNGKQVVVRKRQANTDFVPASFKPDFEEQPVVLSQAQTYNGDDAIVTRNRNVTAEDFEVRLQEEEAKVDGHVDETVGYIGFEQGTVEMLGTEFEVNRTPREITDNWSRIEYQTPRNNTPSFLADMQTFNGEDGCNLRYRDLTKDGVDVRVQEERSDDDETGHGTEAVGYIVSNSERTVEILSAN